MTSILAWCLFGSVLFLMGCIAYIFIDMERQLSTKELLKEILKKIK